VGGEVSKEVIMKRLHVVLAATSLVASATGAAAPVPQSIKVEVGNLDLGSDEGQRILAMRIQRAAIALCKSQVVASLPRNIRKERECIREAKASAEASVQTLTAAAASKSGKDG
jgi:UrcA family protein